MLDRTPTGRRRREALSEAKRAYALRLRSAGATYAQIGVALGLSSTRVAQILAKAAWLAERPQWHNQLPARALNFLIIRDLAEKPEIEAAEALARLTVKELREAPGLGRAALALFAAWLAGLGLTLRDETPTAENEKGAPSRGALLILIPATRRKRAARQHDAQAK